MDPVTEGMTDIVKILLDHYAEVNYLDKYGETPLHWASMLGQTDAAALLLADKADINTRDSKGRTPLALALERGKTLTAAYLRQHGGHE